MVTVDDRAKTIAVDGVTIRPPAQVYYAALRLARHPGAVLTWQQLADACGGDRTGPDTIRQVIRKLRRAVGRDRIETRYGLGYAWRGPAEIIG